MNPKNSKKISADFEVPVFIGDDDDYFFICELPVTDRGEIIDIGYWYETRDYVPVLVTGKRLVRKDEQFLWFFEVECYGNNKCFYCEEDFMVYEFKRLINHGEELIQALNDSLIASYEYIEQDLE